MRRDLALCGRRSDLPSAPLANLRRAVVRGSCGRGSSGADALVRGQWAACGVGGCAMDLGSAPCQGCHGTGCRVLPAYVA
eukprot:scaffold18750_cov113-Isochrysis_galbana.AAC.2